MAWKRIKNARWYEMKTDMVRNETVLERQVEKEYYKNVLRKANWLDI